MRAWANILHFYQPYGQKREIIDMIVAQCYRPVAEGILANPRARIGINLTGVLLDQLADYGHQDVIDMYAEAARRGQVEFVASAKFHTLLPLLPPEEALRQIRLNDETAKKYLGDTYKPKGIFLPEVAWDPSLAPIIEEAGLTWVLLDELALNGRHGQIDYSAHYKIEGSNLGALFREHRLSGTLMSAAPRDVERLKETMHSDGGVVVTAMDGETFGHHRVGHEQILTQIYKDEDLTLLLPSEAASQGREIVVPTVACTWASSEDDIAKGIQFISWRDPKNPIHTLQWQLLELVVAKMAKADLEMESAYKARLALDPALASDEFFWACARPWWMIEYIERGAHDLVAVLGLLGDEPALAKGRDLYHQIMATAWDWQRSGKIDEIQGERATKVRVPFREKTLAVDDPATWHAIFDLIAHEEQSAVARREYEAALMWRDAAYKLEHKLDIFDLEYVLDVLNRKLPAGAMRDVIDKYKQDYERIRSGQSEQRSN